MSVIDPVIAAPADSSAALAERYARVRRASVALAAPLDAEDCVVQTIPEVSPTKWHLAHVTWFFERFCLVERGEGYALFDERFHELFNSYYYTVGQMHPRARRGLLNRPLLGEVLAYRAYVDAAMFELMERRFGEPELEFLVELGLNHEQQHQELLLTDIKHVFFTNPLNPAYRAPESFASLPALPLEFVSRRGGRFAIGYGGDGFAFDNETPRHDVLVDDHRLANRLVTNGEYREFMQDGAYAQSQHWLSDGWSLIAQAGWDRPLYWSEDGEREFTLSGWQTIDPASPVCHLSFYEADAFARWAGARLPSEAEWELAATLSLEGGSAGGLGNLPEGSNTLDRDLLHPVVARETGDFPLQQLWGDVWEWTASPYSAYPGFRPLAGSLGEYNGKFMSNQMVVRGGSCVSWAEHLRSSYRSFFYPQDRWQFLGLRLAKDASA